MKYWLLTTEYPPFFGGGISTYCYHTAMMLTENHHQVTVFVNDVSVTKVKIHSENNIRIVRFNPTQTNASAYLGHDTNISYEFAYIVKQFVEKEGKPDIIEAQEYLGIAYYLLQFKHLLYDWCIDIPVVITMHSPSLLYMSYNKVPAYRYPNYWVCEMELFCIRAADQVISPSKYIITELEQRNKLPVNNFTVIPNPYRYLLPEVHDRIDVKADQIVFYGKLTAQKGVFELLQYFKKLWDTGFARPLYLVGGQDIVYHPEGVSMGSIIRTRYEEYIGDGLLLLEDRVKPSGMANRIERAELVIVPSNNDNFPYVVVEMMALGKMVLVSKQGGQAEMIESGVNGFIFDHAKPDTFSSELYTMLQLTQEQRKVITGKAIERINSLCSYETVYAQKIRILEQLLHKKQLPGETNFPFTHTKPEGNNNSFFRTDNENYLLSVVIPYYNLGKYIGETIQSIKDTQYKNVEIIIVNDGSTDKESLLVLEQYRNDSKISVIDTANMGLAAARNTGASSAKGKFLAFLDADDTVSPEYYVRAVAVLSTYENIHFVGCWSRYFENGSGVWPAFSPVFPLLLFQNVVNSSALVYKRQSFLTGGANDSNMPFPGVEDYDSVVSMVSKNFSGVVLPEVLFQYRVRKESMYRQISKAKKILLSQYMAEKHKTAYTTYATDIINLQTANGPGIWIDNPSLDLHLADKMPFGSKISLKLIRLIKKNSYVRRFAYKIYAYIKK